MLDTLLTGAAVLGATTTAPPEAVGLANGRIAYLGSTADAPKAREHRDLRGCTLAPGIIDSHNHLLLGFDHDAVSLEGAETLDEVRRRIAELDRERADLDWICAENAVYSVVEGRRPRATDLVGVSKRPVFITTYDQHSVWLNDAAIRALGLHDGGSIAWGNVERDERSEPTGWVTDFYTQAMTQAGLDQLRRDIPMYSPERRYRKLRSSIDMAASYGITTVVEPQVPLAEIELLERARAEGGLRTRVIGALFHPIAADTTFRAELAARIRAFDATDRLALGPVKLYADDVIEPHTAWLLDDYANRPGHRGHPSAPVGELRRILTELDALGLQTHTHATGDGGVRLALDAIEHAQRANGTRDRRHGIVHVECLHPDDLDRFADLGVTAAMQPRHCSPDLVAGTWMENIGEQRWDRAWRFNALMRSGAHVALSSDWQVGEMDPLIGMYSGMTRARIDGTEAWTGAERISFGQALDGYTRQGAWAWHLEQERGTIAEGLAADLVIWSEDLREADADPELLLRTEVEETIVGGETVHRRESPAPLIEHPAGERRDSCSTACGHGHHAS